jgi:tetratricopeptide (TPR) repeat protein
VGRARLLAVALALVVGAKARADGGLADDPLRVYRDDNPGLRDEELIDVALGDPVDRVLAFVHNPESGIAVRALRVSEIVNGVAMERRAADLAGRAGASAQGSYLVLVTQDCDERQTRPRARPGSWLFLRGNRLAAWDLAVYGPDCRIVEERAEASDHDVMRVVGEELFRQQGRGRFRYGPLRYDTWDEAFVAPTRPATLSLLRAHAAAAPTDAAAQNRLAVALYAAGDREGAVARLERAVELDPSAAEPHRNLAVVYRQRGDRAAAAREEALAEASSKPAVGTERAP